MFACFLFLVGRGNYWCIVIQLFVYHDILNPIILLTDLTGACVVLLSCSRTSSSPCVVEHRPSMAGLI